MRVTANTFPDTLVDQLSQLAVRQNRLQSQAATGQRIQLPEDDPTAMRRVIDLQNESKNLGQYQRNISTLKEYAGASFMAIKSLEKICDRAGEIATLADDTKSPEELRIYAIEINQLLEQSVQLANTKHRGDYLFGGTQTDKPPFTLGPVETNGRVNSVSYNGNSDLPQNEIAEDTMLTVQVPGSNTATTGTRGLIVDATSGADFFQHLISLRDNLYAGNTETIVKTDRVNLAKDEENILFHLGTNGAIQSRLETASTVAQTRGNSIEVLISNEADADLAQTLVRLNEAQNAYKAALQSGATILSRSLMDYLR